MLRSPGPSLRRVLRASLAPFLLLVTPFTIYVQYQQYGFGHPEVMLFALALAVAALLVGAVAALSPFLEVVLLAGLITLFADIQLLDPGLRKLGVIFLGLCAGLWLVREHAARIVSLMMATVLCLSLLPSRSPAVAMGTPAPAPGRDLPLIVHLVFDEHIGLEGLPEGITPPDFQRELQSFFVERGFRLFGNAYSEYPTTLWSISQLMNLAPGGYVPGLTRPGEMEGTYRLTRNDYFDRLAGRGYAIRVHQPDYVDVCTDRVPASACRTYPVRTLRMLERLAVPAHEKLSIVAGTYLVRSEAYMRVKAKYWTIRRRLVDTGVALPTWNWERSTPAPVGTMPMFDALAEELSAAQPGTFVYAHLLMPHYPYVYDAGCRQRPPSEWLTRNDPDGVDVPGGEANVEEGRAARYRLYLQQVECTGQKIDALIDAIPPRLRQEAIVIIHGDHGSRISLMDPTIVARSTPAPSDYADHFSTLFAVRSPDLEPGYDVRQRPITCLLRTLVESDFRSVAAADACSTSNVVFFFGGDTPQPRPLPAFRSPRSE